MSDDIKFGFGDEFQLGIFEIMMYDTGFCQKVVGSLKPEYFKNQYYSWFFIKIKELVLEYQSAPSHLQLKNEILRFPPEKQEIYFKIYQKITKVDNKRDHKYIRDNLEEFVKKCLRFQLNEILVKNQNKDSDYVDDLVKKKVEEMQGVNFSKVPCQSIRHMSTIMEEASVQNQETIPTFLPNIDRALGGGIQKHTLTLGLSGTNVGKSIWMINWAYHLIRGGYKVFFVTLEGFERQTMLRLAARAIGTTFGNIRSNNLSDIEMQKRNEFEEKYKDSLQIYYDSSFGMTIEKLADVARQKKEEFDFDVMMVDYGQLLKTNNKTAELRHQQSDVHRGLSSLAGPQELDCAVITVAQGNRETQEKNGKGKGLIRMNDISECFEIIRCCATVLTLNRSEMDVESDTVRILLDKSRDGRTNTIDICKTNMDRLAFYGDADEGLGFMPVEDYSALIR